MDSSGENEEQEHTVHIMADLFGQKRFVSVPKDRKTERGELLRYFSEKTGKPIAYIAFKLTRFSLEDMYYLKSNADACEREKRGEWGWAFWGSLKPKEE